MTDGTSETSLARRDGALAELRAEELVQRLNSLVDGDRVTGHLIALGSAAIGPLKRFLLLGKQSVVYQPRRWSVEALGGIGAKDALIEYLTSPRSIPDPAVRMAEDAVQNAAALELARLRTPDVLDALLRLAPQRRPRSGLVEALGQFQCAEAIPYFVNALEDDVCRNAAEEALRRLGRTAESALVAAARTRLPSPDEETPSSRQRRFSALELLADLKPASESWPLLKPLLADPNAGIVTGAAKIAVLLGGREERTLAAARLLEVFPEADWRLRMEIQDCLLSLYADAKSRIEREIDRRSARPETERLKDEILRTLTGIQRRAGLEAGMRRGPTP